MNKIEIYTSNTCGYCKTLKEELTKNNIEFEEKLTADFKDEWEDIVGFTGKPNIPTVYYKENYFAPGRDFNGAVHLINIIKGFKSCSFSSKERILEKLKTLNYNIHMAFNQLDQLLRKIETKLNTEEKDEHKSTS